MGRSHERAIQTTYQDVEFRSRLEATWAAFFDQMRWPWEYEPIDLRGYIPDFILPFSYRPILVEIKPCFSIDDLLQHIPQLKGVGWTEEILLLGTRPFPSTGRTAVASVGLLGEPWPDDNGKFFYDFDEATGFFCRQCRVFSFFHRTGTPHCRVTGCPEIDEQLVLNVTQSKDLMDDAWKRASNHTRWYPSGDL